MTTPVTPPPAIVSERTSADSHTSPPAAVIAPASDRQMPIVPSGQKPNFLNALLVRRDQRGLDRLQRQAGRAGRYHEQGQRAAPVGPAVAVAVAGHQKQRLALAGRGDEVLAAGDD